jgi:hypothetical protein
LHAGGTCNTRITFHHTLLNSFPELADALAFVNFKQEGFAVINLLVITVDPKVTCNNASGIPKEAGIQEHSITELLSLAKEQKDS